jgi:hypothetical protein
VEIRKKKKEKRNFGNRVIVDLSASGGTWRNKWSGC